MFTHGLGAVPIAFGTATATDARSRAVVEMLAAVADLIVPRDQAPSASDIGVHHRVLAQAEGIPNYPQLLSEGLGWLEQRARADHRSPFLALSTETQAEILTAAFEAPAQTLPSVFAQRIRADVLTAYYRDARAWVEIGFDQPVQPMGYPDFEVPPA